MTNSDNKRQDDAFDSFIDALETFNPTVRITIAEVLTMARRAVTDAKQPLDR